MKTRQIVIEQEYYSPKEVRKLLGISETLYFSSIHPLVKNGTIHSLRLGRRRLISRQSLLEVLHEEFTVRQECETTS